MSFWQMSFSGAVMILAIAVIRALTIHKLPKRTFIALWYLVFLRLLIPFSIPSVFSAYSLLNPRMVDSGNDSVVTNFSAYPHNGGNVSVWIIWGIGAIVLLAYFTVSYIRCCREFETSLPVESETTAEWLAGRQEKRTICIRQSGCISTPLTYGTRHPVILMPKNTDWCNQGQLNYVLLHELVHIKRFDALKKILSAFVLCIHWFNPLVWMMYVLFNYDIELACDETVVNLLGEKSKAEYARALINMEETRSGFQPLCNHFNKNAIEERITAIMKMKKKSILTCGLAFLLVLGTATVFATSAKDSYGTSDVKADAADGDEEYVLVTKLDGNEEYVLLEPAPDLKESDVLENKKAALQENGTENIYVLEVDVATLQDSGAVYHVDDEKEVIYVLQDEKVTANGGTYASID